jgi:hypothetical protein
MIDCEALCAERLVALKRNQNTEMFGRVGAEDGVRRDAEGREVEGRLGFGALLFKGIQGGSGEG